ncbi:MAG: hypothetical protein QOJ68_3325, partial [Blastococcus sp.]|nr:hypothetical protein [Blastococcus sp.]
MTSLLGARKRAEEFAGAVDSTDVTALHPDLRVLVDLTTALRSTPQAQPRTEFTAELRDLLLAEAEQILNPASASLALPLRPRGTRERRMVAVAASVVVFGGTASMAAAAQNALPGQALYPVKRGIEQAQVSLSFTDEGKGRDLLSQANDRLGEVRGLLADGSIGSRPEVTQTLAEFSAQARDGSRLMISAFD